MRMKIEDDKDDEGDDVNNDNKVNIGKVQSWGWRWFRPVQFQLMTYDDEKFHEDKGDDDEDVNNKNDIEMMTKMNIQIININEKRLGVWWVGRLVGWI